MIWSSRRQGSITIFLALTFTCIMALCFTLIEGIRLVCVRQQASILADTAVQSAFAQYNRFLWENYRILAVDASYGKGDLDIKKMEERMQAYLNENGNPEGKGVNFMQLAAEPVSSEYYGLLTDQDGIPFLKQAALVAKMKLPEEALSKMLGECEEAKETEDGAQDVDELLKAAEDAAKEAEEGTEEAGDENEAGEMAGEGAQEMQQNPSPPEEPVDNPVELLKILREKTILAQVIADPEALSDKKLPAQGNVSGRALAKGNAPSEGMVSLPEKVLFTNYAMSFLTSYRKHKKRGGMKYEWEYLICGKKEDKENLEGIVTRLLVLREAGNMASLLADTVKVSEAETLAAAIIGWTANPALIEALKWGIIAAWSYIESVLDVRLLLSGGKVSLIKSAAEWTGDIKNITSYFPADVKAMECPNGIDYEYYLMVLSFQVSDKDLGLRSLDLIEYTMRQEEGYANIKADALVYCGKYHYGFSSEPVFFGIVPELSGGYLDYAFEGTRELSYLDN